MAKYKFTMEFESESTSVELVIKLMQPILVDTLAHLCANKLMSTLEVLQDEVIE